MCLTRFLEDLFWTFRFLPRRSFALLARKSPQLQRSLAEIADAALALIEIEYEELPSVLSVVDALEDASHRVHDQPAKVPPNVSSRVHGRLVTFPPDSNIVSHLITEHGDIEKAFRSADRVFEHTFAIPSVHQGYLEPHACQIAIDDDGTVNVWISNKAPHPTRVQIADTIGVPIEKVVLHPVMIGGDFGGKGDLMDAPLCYYLARHTGRPVKMVMTYFEELTAANPRHAASIFLQTALDRDAKILGIKAKLLFDTGAYAGFCPVITLHGYVTFGGAYCIPNLHLEVFRVYTNSVPAGHMRGPGGPQITFALESHFDIISNELQIDPIKFRRMNAIAEGDLSPIGERRKFIHCGATIDAALAKWDWNKAKGANVGRGIALYEYPPGTYDRSTVEFVFSRSGIIQVNVGAPDTGTGFHTIVAQLVAEHFRIPTRDVDVRHPDTKNSAYEKGPSASRLTTTICQAIDDAAKKSKARFAQIVAKHFGCNLEEVRENDGQLFFREQILDLKAILEIAAGFGEETIIQSGENVSRPSSEITGFATQIAEVHVDRETGKVDILRILTAHDVGRVLNTVTHQGQIEGGLIQGIGQAMFEQLHRQDGAVISASLGDYKLPCIMDVPALETVLVTSEQADAHMVKSIGEISNAAIVAAISNAIYDAVGVRLMELPLSAERIYRALQSRKLHS